MATTKKPAPKLEAPQPGKCRRIINGKRHNAPVPADHPNWTWCADCVKAHRLATKTAKAKAPTKAKATTPKPKTPATAVAAAAAKVDAVDPMERELAAVKAMKTPQS